MVHARFMMVKIGFSKMGLKLSKSILDIEKKVIRRIPIIIMGKRSEAALAIVSSPFMVAYMQKINMLNRIIAELVVGKIVVVIKVPNSVNEIKVVRIKKTKSTR